MDLLKNPIIIGLLSAVVAYGYLYWKEQQRQNENPDLEKKPVNFMIPGVIGALVWFIMGSLNRTNMQLGGSVEKSLPVNSVIHKYNENVELKSNNSHKSGNSFDSKSYKLVKKGNIQLPSQDVFLDLGSNW